MLLTKAAYLTYLLRYLGSKMQHH